MLANHFFEDVPNNRLLSLDHFARLLDRCGVAFGFEPDRATPSYSFVAPVAYTLELLMLWSDQSRIVTFGISGVLGMAAGSAAIARNCARPRCSAALAAGRLRSMISQTSCKEQPSTSRRITLARCATGSRMKVRKDALAIWRLNTTSN